MINKVYETYEKTGLDWLSEIPKGWELISLRRGIDFLTDFEANGSFADVKKNVELDTDEKYAWYLRATDLQNNRNGISDDVRTCNKKAYDYLAKTKLYGNEFLVAKRGEIGKIYIVPKLKCKATLAPNLYLIRLNEKLNTKFTYYWYSSSYGKPELFLADKSTTIGALYKDDVRACKILLPSLTEQTQIANFLDYETAQIDTLIDKQQTLIQLLKEKRQAVISHAVTKGLNPNTPMKDSGVEWLGKVPEHWEVSKLKYLISEPLQYGANEAAEDVDKTQPRFVRITDVLPNGNLKDDTFRSLPQDIAEPYMLMDGDVLLARSGGTVGKSFIYRDSWGKCCFAGYLIKAKIDENITPAEWFYLNTLTDFYWKWIESIQIQATIQNVSADKYNSFVIAVPPLEESYKIISHIKFNLEVFDTLVMKAEQAIQLMQERRTALISAAVTGKIDVRGWVAPSTNN